MLIGENLVIATAGQATATLLFEDAEPVPLLDLQEDEEGDKISRVRQEGGFQRGATRHGSALPERLFPPTCQNGEPQKSAKCMMAVPILDRPNRF